MASSQPGPAVPARRRGVALLELLEDRISRGERNSGASVLDLEIQQSVLATPDGYANAAFFREVHRVAREINEHLAQSRRVANHARRAVPRHGTGDLQRLPLRARSQ